MPVMTKPVKLPHPDAVERRELRSSHSKTFSMPDGKMRCDVKVGTLAHYRDDDGSLRSCDCTVQQDAGKVFVDWLPYRFRLHDKGIGFDFQSRESGRCSVTLVGIGGKKFARNQPLKPTIEGDKITFAEVVPGIDIVFRILPARVKSWRIVKNANAPRTFEWLCEHDADGRDKISDKLFGKDAANNQLELQSNVIAIDDKSFRFVETWTGKVKLRDKKTRIKSLSDAVVYPASIDPTVNYSIANTANDIYEDKDGNQFDTTFLPVGGSSGYSVGVRFLSVAVPNAATIDSATLTVNLISGGGYGYQAFTIRGYDTDSAAAWSAGVVGIDVNPTTTANTPVNPVGGGTGIKNYDVTSTVQEIINRAGWSSGNNLSLELIKDSYQFNYGTYFEDYQDAGTNQASLSITYSAGVSAAVTGTATSSITEADVVSGGKTIILTLTNDTWVAFGASFNAQRQAIINGIDSAQAEGTGWDAVVKATQGVSGVVRTSDTVVTITLDAFATYNITAQETITVTVPSSALTGGVGAVVASPTFTVAVVSSGPAAAQRVIAVAT